MDYSAHLADISFKRSFASDCIEFIKQIDPGLFLNQVKYLAKLCACLAHELRHKFVHLDG